MCRGQNNGIFRIELILGTKARNMSPILGEDFLFRDHLILETKFNIKWSKNATIFEEFQKCAAIGKS